MQATQQVQNENNTVMKTVTMEATHAMMMEHTSIATETQATRMETNDDGWKGAEDKSTEPTRELIEVSPKEWQKHHNTWLNAVMRKAIGEENHPQIPDLQEFIPVY